MHPKPPAKSLPNTATPQLANFGPLLASQPNLLPAHYTGFVARDNAFYKPIRDAGLATGKLGAR